LKIVTAAGQSDEMLLKYRFRFHEKESSVLLIMFFYWCLLKHMKSIWMLFNN